MEDCVGKFFAERLGELFAVLTDDGGHTWKDITEHLKPVTLLPPVRGADSGRRIYWLSSSQIYLLTRHGRVIESSDGGETWRQVVRFEEGRSNRPTGFYKLLFNAGGKFSLLGGSTGDEGYWANLVTSEARDSWQSYELVLVPLLDAVSLSENEILACGREFKPHDESAKSRKSPVGVVVHSKDNGRTWSTLYRTSSDETLLYITKIIDTEFYAVSDIGNFIKIRMI